MGRRVTIDADGWVEDFGAEVAEEYVKKYNIVLNELLNNEQIKIYEEGIQPGEWLFEYVYEADLAVKKASVYGVYSPRRYKRRYTSSGGFASEDSLDLEIEGNSLKISNTSMYNSSTQLDQPLEEFIAHGNIFPNPRNFYDAAIDYYDVNYIKERLESIINSRIDRILSEAFDITMGEAL